MRFLTKILNKKILAPKQNLIILIHFSVNAGFGAGDSFNGNAGFQVGNPLQSNFLFPVIIGLGLLSLFNVVLTIITPLLTKKPADDSGDDNAGDDTGARSQRMLEMANMVMEAVQKLRERHE